MKVLLLRADQSGCAYYRMIEPARAIREAGIDIEIEIDDGLDVDGERAGGSTSLHSVDPHGADVVVFQRPSNMMMLDAIRLLQVKGVACVVEIDDLFHAVSNAHAGHGGIIEDKAADRILDCAQQADLVTVTTKALARFYGRKTNVHIIPNAIPRRIAELPPAYLRGPEAITVGWTGSVFTHPHDLQEMGTGLRTALDRSQGKARFIILGQSMGAQERLGLASPPAEYPWLPDVDHYLQTVGREFDVGLAPLRDDKFNAAKSWLKPLEYAARGVYAIRSPTYEYTSLGIGRYCKNAKDWAIQITKAVQDPLMRGEYAEKMRDRVLDAHLTEHTAELWVAAWREALDIRARA